MEKNYDSVKLSSKWTKFGYYFLIVTLIFAVPAALYLAYSLIQYFQLNLFLTMILLVALIIGCIYVIKTLSEGTLEDDIIYINKINKPKKKYTLDQLEKVKVYENKRDKYIVVTLNDGRTSEKYLLTNSKLFYAGDLRNTDSILKEIYENNQKKRQL